MSGSILRAAGVLLSVCLAGMATQVPSQSLGSDRAEAVSHKYFPSGVFNASPPLDSSTATWYACTLSALAEPSLFEFREDKAVHVYRFLWLPSFHRPISVRLTIRPDGGSSLVAKSVDKHTGLLTADGQDSGKLILDTVAEVDDAQVQDLLKQLQNLDFWSMTTEEQQTAVRGSGDGREILRLPPLDGARWVLEGLRNGEYHVVDRWSPRNDAYAKLCKHFLRVGKVEVEEKDLY
jgi:hypothetical protein